MPPKEKQYTLYPIPSPDDIVKNKNYTETKQILRDVEHNVHNFLAIHKSTEIQKKMSKTLRFLCDDLLGMVKNITEEEERIWDFIIDVIYEIVDETEHKMDFEAKKEYLWSFRETAASNMKVSRLMVKEVINKYIHDFDDEDFIERIMLIYDNHESTYFVMAANVVKLYNTLVNIYRVSEDNRAKRELMQPGPSSCDNCGKDIFDGDVCPVNGKVCFRGKIVTPPDWSDSSRFYSY